MFATLRDLDGEEEMEVIPTNTRFDVLKPVKNKKVKWSKKSMDTSGYSCISLPIEVCEYCEERTIKWIKSRMSIMDMTDEYRIKHCLNCGKHNHNYSSCKLPITSVGLIAYRNDGDKLKYLMIRRRHSLGFMEYVRGRYPLHNRPYMINIINEMTMEEKRKIMEEPFDTLWSELWGDYGKEYAHDKDKAKAKAELFKRGVLIDGQYYTLSMLMDESTTRWETPEYGFPKGRRNAHETDLEVGIREFCEETGYRPHHLNMVENIAPFDEIFTGSNFKSYKHSYFIANITDTEYLLDRYQKTEVADIGWFTYEECVELIRGYYVERMDILDRVNYLLCSL